MTRAQYDNLPQPTRSSIESMERKAPPGTQITLAAMTLDQLIVHDSGTETLPAQWSRRWGLIEPVVRFVYQKPYPRFYDPEAEPPNRWFPYREWVVFLNRHDGRTLQNYQVGPKESLCKTTFGWQR